MSDPTSFTMPGFDFLQGLVKNAGAALPGIGQWVAPTIDPAELEKRIEELRTVQFWLEQNARMLATTIQALEVQRMTLSTLKTMNVQMEDLRDSLKIPTPAAAVAKADGADAPSTGGADPMQWWGALTRQFTEIATTAMKDHAMPAAAPSAPTASPAGPKAAARKPARAKTGARKPATPPARRP